MSQFPWSVKNAIAGGGNPSKTYRMAASFTNANGYFFVITGGSRVVTVTRLWLYGSGALGSVYLWKHSSAPTGGTGTEANKVPLDSSNGSSTVGSCKYYTAVPTIGTTVGTIDYWSFTASSSYTFLPRNSPSESPTPVVLRGGGECLLLQAAGGVSTTVYLSCEWTEA